MFQTIFLIVSLSAIACIMAWQTFNQIKLEVEVDELAVKLGRTVEAVSFLTKLIKQMQSATDSNIQIQSLENIELIDVSDDENDEDEDDENDEDEDDENDDDDEKDEDNADTDDRNSCSSEDELENDNCIKQIEVDLSIYEPESSLSSPILSESGVKIKLVNSIIPDNILECGETPEIDEVEYKKMPVAEIRKLASSKLSIDASRYKKTQLVEMLLKPMTPPMSPSPLHFSENDDDFDDIEDDCNIINEKCTDDELGVKSSLDANYVEDE